MLGVDDINEGISSMLSLIYEIADVEYALELNLNILPTKLCVYNSYDKVINRSDLTDQQKHRKNSLAITTTTIHFSSTRFDHIEQF